MALAPSGGLRVNELTIPAIEGEKLIVRSELRNSAMIEHHDAVRRPDRRQPMRDDEGGSAPDQPLEGLLHKSLRLAVQGGGRLIQQ